MESRFQIDRFAVRNFRSIVECDVDLAPLTFFIGANASGKTSFIDAMLFVASALRNSPAKAIADRGAIHSILHHPIKLPASCQFDFYLSFPMGLREFHLDLRILDGWSVHVAREECRINNRNGEENYYVVEDGSVRGSATVFPSVSSDRIFLSNASGLPEFRQLFDFLSNLGWTEPTQPGVHQALQTLTWKLRRLNTVQAEDTSLAARFHKLANTQPERLEIIQQYLRAIAPPFDRIEVDESQDMLWLRFVEKSKSGTSMPFYLSQASAGLVNSAEMLLELFELPGAGKPASTVIIEEPEALLHPGAIQVLRDSFVEASRTRQVLVTTHSPDLLDDPAVPPESIRTVYRDEAGTHVDVLDPSTQSIIREQLYTAGQLLRQGGLILKS